MARVLVVEDNRLNQLVVVTNLKKLGHEVDVADDGMEAVTKFEANRFDAIIMDIQMPVMDGYEATAAIRSAQASRGESPVLIIGLSAGASIEDHHNALAMGLNGYLTKPLRVPELAEALERGLHCGSRSNPPAADPLAIQKPIDSQLRSVP